jgi:transposase
MTANSRGLSGAIPPENDQIRPAPRRGASKLGLHQKSSRNGMNPWEYDREMYRRRNEVERLFRRLKGFRRIFSRFDKLDVMFVAFIHFALIVEALR